MFANGENVNYGWMPYILDSNRSQSVQVTTILRLRIFPVLIVEHEVLGLIGGRMGYSSGSGYDRIV